jgi:citrate synthase
MAKPVPKTHIAKSDATSITIRGENLVEDLIGKKTFSEMIYFLIRGHHATAAETRVLDACLVTLMEHGFTPSALVTRVVTDAVPNQVQVAMAAGLLTIGEVFVGTMEGCAALLAQGIGSPDTEVFCAQVAREHLAARKPIPGFGHPFHKPDDPRSPRLFRVAREAGIAEPYINLLEELSRAVDREAGRHLTINATGAIAALLLGIGISPDIMRAVAVISRCGGLAGHILEERATGSARVIWSLTERNIPYEPQSE